MRKSGETSEAVASMCRGRDLSRRRFSINFAPHVLPIPGLEIPPDEEESSVESCWNTHDRKNYGSEVVLRPGFDG
jgi:hypothetical protein